MTREELEKEAIAKYKTGSYPQLHPDHWAFVHGYLAGAEPREKRIAELEQQIDEQNKNANSVIHDHQRRIVELEQQIKEMKGIILCTCEGCSRLPKLYKAFEEIEK